MTALENDTEEATDWGPQQSRTVTLARPSRSRLPSWAWP